MESPFSPLDRRDPSYEKLIELERRMVAATNRGDLKWEPSSGAYQFNGTKGSVRVSPAGVEIYDDYRLQRKFSYTTFALYDAAHQWYEAMANSVLDAILADLEAM